MEINNIGNNAGLVWNALNANGKMTETKLKKETGLASAEFFAALGWLAREGKVATVVETRCGTDCEYYTLNASLLVTQIKRRPDRAAVFSLSVDFLQNLFCLGVSVCRRFPDCCDDKASEHSERDCHYEH